MSKTDNKAVACVIGKAGFTPRKGEVAKVAIEIRRLGKAIDTTTVREVAAKLNVRDTASVEAEFDPDHNDEDEDAPKDLRALVEALEALHDDIIVIDSKSLGHGQYVLKLQTPISTYLSEGSASDWMEQARADIDATSKFACVFCMTKLPWSEEGGIGSCKSCKAVYDDDVENLAQRCGYTSASPGVAVAALADIGATFRTDKAHVHWAKRAKTLKAHPLGKALEGVEGPSMTVGTAEIGLLLDADSVSAEILEKAEAATHWKDVVALGDPAPAPAEEDHEPRDLGMEEGWLRTGWCRNCVHGLVTQDRSNTIYGVDSFGHTEDNTHCVRPLNARKDLKGLHEMLGLEPTQARGYRTVYDGIFANIVIRAAMTGLFQVDDKGPGLEGRAPDELGGYVGPLCPAYKADPDGLFEWGDFRLAGATVPVVFGEPDENRIEKEKAAERLRLDWAAARDILQALRADEVAGPILGTKIQMSNVRSPAANKLIEILEKHLPDSILERGVCARFRSAFAIDVSGSAAEVLDMRLRTNAATRRVEEQAGT